MSNKVITHKGWRATKFIPNENAIHTNQDGRKMRFDEVYWYETDIGESHSRDNQCVCHVPTTGKYWVLCGQDFGDQEDEEWYDDIGPFDTRDEALDCLMTLHRMNGIDYSKPEEV